MPKKQGHVPTYRKHRATGQAVVTLDARDFYLGRYGSRASLDRYDRMVNEWLAAGRRLPQQVGELPVKSLILLFLQFAKKYYRDAAGEVAAEFENYVTALGPLRKLYGDTNAAEFGPLALKAVRESMIAMGWARTTVNRQIARIKRVFKWATENEHIPADIHQALDAVEGLRRGRSEAKETEPVKPVADWIIDATLPHLSPTVAAMVRLQRLTGMRPAELCALRVDEIDRTGSTWWYRPGKHKTQHLGHAREIPLGPRARQILEPLIGLTIGDGFVFKPTDAIAQRQERDAAKRKTPLNHGNRPGTNRVKKPKRTPGENYDVAAYRRAITRAADRADAWAKGATVIGNDERVIPRWHPHQMRHTAATELRASHGADVAGAMLGHRSLNATQIYADRDRKLMERVAEQVG